MESSEENLRPCNVRRVGPMVVVSGGDIIMNPRKVNPLNNFNKQKIYADAPSFFKQIENDCMKWFEEFPECCEAHIKLKGLQGFNKSDYEFIPKQIELSIAYLIHSIETLIDYKYWCKEITDYINYLLMSLGSPRIGDHIFKHYAKYVIENIIPEKGIDDDKRLELLLVFEPKIRPEDFKDRDLELLYNSFITWLENMPDFGLFLELKQTMRGKVPLNLFVNDWTLNRYTGMVSGRMKSKRELLDSLNELTNKICKTTSEQIRNSEEQIQNFDLLIAAEEKMKLECRILLDYSPEQQELDYCFILKNWFDIIIDYYKSININLILDHQDRANSRLEKIETKNTEISSMLHSIKSELLELSSQNLISRLKISEISPALESVISKVDEGQISSEELNKIFGKILESVEADIDPKNDKRLLSKLSDPKIGIKHKLKLSIPLFIGVKYEGELELGQTEKIPNTIKELKNLLFE